MLSTKTFKTNIKDLTKAYFTSLSCRASSDSWDDNVCVTFSRFAWLEAPLEEFSVSELTVDVAEF